MDKTISLIIGAAVLLMAAIVVIFAGSSTLSGTVNDAGKTQTSIICQTQAEKYCQNEIEKVDPRCAEYVQEQCSVPDSDIVADSVDELIT
ncbi:MAG: hypothetical protein ABEJ75_01500 [Candidatus Nanohaloarchaea archaeon]